MNIPNAMRINPIENQTLNIMSSEVILLPKLETKGYSTTNALRMNSRSEPCTTTKKVLRNTDLTLACWGLFAQTSMLRAVSASSFG